VAGYYDPNKDYSAAIEAAKNSGASQAEINKLTQERQNKIDDKYGGVEPNMYNSNQKYSEASNNRTGTSTSSGGTTMSNQQAIQNAVQTANKVQQQKQQTTQPAAPDYSQYVAPQTQQNNPYAYAQYASFNPNANYAADAEAAAARGDWGAVATALAQRAAKIQSQGGNDRGMSNDALLNQLKQTYGNSYNQLSTRDQDLITLYSGGTVKYDNGVDAYHLGTGWNEGVDYYAEAMKYAQAGDLDAAYDALMRRGFKMQDTGSTGGGTSQADAYAKIHQLYLTSTGALDTWAREKTKNQENLAASGVLDAKINPSNAYKTLVKNGYNVVYDGNGVPIYAYRQSNKVGTNGGYINYKPEEIEALKAYYQSDNPDEYATLYMNRHNARYDANNRQPWFDGYGAKYDTTTGRLQLSDSDVPVYSRDITANSLAGTMNPVQLVQPGAPNVAPPVQNLPTMGGNSALDLPMSGGGNVSGNINISGGGGSYKPGSLGDYLDDWLAAAQQQQTNTIDFGTNQAVLDLIRQQQDAEATFQEQRNQIAIDEAKAKDNQALYAESRGDKGGIGAAQYDSIMNTAAQNRLQVNSAQQKLATDTARQIADLRAQGEYEKADALLQLSQQYLAQLINLEQWSMEYTLSVAQFNASLQQWAAEYEMAVADLTGYYNGTPTLKNQQYQNELALTQQNQMASAGETLLSAGIMPSASQLAAMGITSAQAQNMITAAQLAATQKNSGGGGGGNPTTADIDGLFEAALEQDSPWTWIKSNYKKYGLTAQPDKSEFEAYQSENTYSEDDVSATAKAWYTDLYKFYGSQEDRLNAIIKEYNNGDSWMTNADRLWLLDKLQLR
jgi:hypothetical protein